MHHVKYTGAGTLADESLCYWHCFNMNHPFVHHPDKVSDSLERSITSTTSLPRFGKDNPHQSRRESQKFFLDSLSEDG